ncbi:MAG TPA: sugar phosphate isomerase/epimerase family protein [Kofleriaceae bacterium]|jgi:sugar phosphate isomerase/epimerase|nr:sugar phosphate isomerase/epimerase family protein [Kofleriaceae bacterium]
MKAPRTGQALGVCCKKGNDWLDYLARLDGHGFEHVELTIGDASPSSPAYDPGYRQRVRRAIGELGLGVSLHCAGGTNLAEKVERIRRVSLDIACEAVEIADDLGARWVTLHLGTAGISNGQADRKRARLALVVDSVAQILARTAGSRVILGLENLPRLPDVQALSRLGDCAEEFAIVLAQLESPRVGVVFDIGHARIHRPADRHVRDFLAAVAPRVVGFHLHWNDSCEDLHAPLALGERDELDGYLDAVGADLAHPAPVLLECHALSDNLASAAVLRALG